jgi:hypothetical protein
MIRTNAKTSEGISPPDKQLAGAKPQGRERQNLRQPIRFLGTDT